VRLSLSVAPELVNAAEGINGTNVAQVQQARRYQAPAAAMAALHQMLGWQRRLMSLR
jgi:hypothetical protein